MTLADALAVLRPGLDPLRDYAVADAGAGPYLARWDAAALGPPPTAEQVAAVTPGQVRAARGAWVSCLAFISRIGPEKQAAVYAASNVDPSVGLLVFRLTAATEINAADPQVVAGITALVAAGVLTQGDADALLA